jgi:ribonuclease T2
MRQFPVRLRFPPQQSPLSPRMVAVNNRFCFVLNASLRLSNAYSGVVMTRVVLCVALLPLLLTPRAGTAQDPRQNAPGQFDFYVLSLSWSPSFCAGAAGRGADAVARNVQCGPRPYSFHVHGLWPQYDNGFPEYCRLIFNEWDRHGTCSGQSPRVYFETVRKARAAVKIPPEFTDLKEPLSVTPHAVEEAFINANPGLIGERDGGRLRCQTIDRSAPVSFQGSPVSRLCGNCQAQLQARAAHHAADARRLRARAVRYDKSSLSPARMCRIAT